MSEETDSELKLVTWELDDAEEVHREAPSTFWIPSREQRDSLRGGDTVKLIFRMFLRDSVTGEEQVEVERMWVAVSERHGNRYKGLLDNDPYCTTDLRSGEVVEFEAKHVIQIYDAGEKQAPEPQRRP